MANIMLRRGQSGELIFYLPKKDLEEVVSSIEFDKPDCWGGRLDLGDGQSYFIKPLPEQPKLPISLRAQRL